MDEDPELRRLTASIVFLVTLGLCYWISSLQPINYWLSWIIYLPISFWNGEDMPSFFEPFDIGKEGEYAVFIGLSILSVLFLILTASIGIKKCRKLIKADSAKLNKIAQYDSDPDVQKLAIKAIDDEQVLQQIAIEEITPDVQKSAVKRLKALGYKQPENKHYIGSDLSQKSVFQIIAIAICFIVWLYLMKMMGDEFMSGKPWRDYFYEWIVLHVLFRGLTLGAFMASIFVGFHYFIWKRSAKYIHSFGIYQLVSLSIIALIIYSISESGAGLQTSGGTLVYKGTTTFAGRATALSGWEGPVANTTGLLAALAILIYYYPLPWYRKR